MSFTRVLLQIASPRAYSAALSLIAAALIMWLTACAPTSTQTPVPTPLPENTLTILERYTPQPTPDLAAMGAPTLPPTFTSTFTPTPSATPTPTFTASITPTPRAEDVCDALEFPAESVDGLTFGANDGTVFIVQSGYIGAVMTWILTDLATDTSEVLTFQPEEAAAVSPSLLVNPGRYRWTLYITTPDYERICERSVTFTVLAAPTAPPPNLIDLLRELLATTPAPTSAP